MRDGDAQKALRPKQENRKKKKEYSQLGFYCFYRKQCMIYTLHTEKEREMGERGFRGRGRKTWRVDHGGPPSRIGDFMHKMPPATIL